MQRLGALAFQTAAGGHLLGRRLIAGLEIWVGKWYLSLTNRPATMAMGYQEYLLQCHSCNPEQCCRHFAAMGDHPLWKLVNCCTHLSVPKSHLLFLHLFQEVSPALCWWKLPFLSRFHRELLESWEPRPIRADLIRPPDALTPSEYLPVVFVAHALEASAHHVGCPSLPSFPGLKGSTPVHAGVGVLTGDTPEGPWATAK